jgi:thioredoxin 1
LRIDYPGNPEKIAGRNAIMITKILLGVLIGGAIGDGLGYFGKCSVGTCPLTANPYRGAIYGAVMGALLVSVFSQVPKETKESSNIIHISSEADFKTHVLDATGICLVDLFSNRCPPCRVLAPTISLLADKYAGKIAVCKVDVDRVTAVAQRYRVRAIPTVLIIKNGKEVERLVGLRTEAEYAALLDKLTDETKGQVSN